MEASQMMGLYHIEVATYEDGNNKFMFMMGKDHHHDHHDDEIDIGSESTISSSNLSKGSSSSDLLDDASSSPSPPSPSSSSSSSPRQSNSPLYEFSNLMEQLPIKKGLSNYYQGRSQSFTSLAKAQNLEDLAKKETSYQRKLKACRSYGGDLNNFRSYNNHPKAAISKKPSSKGSLSNLSCLSRNSSFIDSCRPPLGPPQSSY